MSYSARPVGLADAAKCGRIAVLQDEGPRQEKDRLLPFEGDTMELLPVTDR